MKLSKKSRYGITALIDLSINSKSGHVSLSSIAERNDISPQYLEQVFAGLRRYGIVKSIKGAHGGYLLNKPAEKIAVGEIIEALDGTYRIEDDVTGNEEEERVADRIIKESVIDIINDQLDNVLLNITLADLEKDYLEYNATDDQMYYI